MPSSRPLSNKVGVPNAYFTLPNLFLQSDHWSPVKGESESSKSRNRSHISHAGFSSSAKRNHMLADSTKKGLGLCCYGLHFLKLGRMERKSRKIHFAAKYICSGFGKYRYANLKWTAPNNSWRSWESNGSKSLSQWATIDSMSDVAHYSKLCAARLEDSES
jgi:hypothetical protein